MTPLHFTLWALIADFLRKLKVSVTIKLSYQ
jgi:hypothetical protein